MEKPVNPPVAASALSKAQIRSIIAGVIFAMALAALNQTVVASSLPTIGRALGDFNNLPWVITAYLVAATAIAPIYGSLSDIYGRRQVLLVSITLFLMGSIACALASSMLGLILARAFQGIGGGGLLALAQTIIADIIPPRERGRYQGYFASVMFTANVGGPVLGGLIAEHLDWSGIFWMNLPLGLLALAVSSRTLKLLPPKGRAQRLDLLGAAILVAATVSLLLALTWGGTTYPWGSWRILGLFATSALLWAGLYVQLLRAPAPLIPLDIIRNRVALAALACSFFGWGANFALPIYLPLYFETVLGLSASQSGVMLAIILGGTVIGAVSSGQTIMRFERYKRTPLVGLTVSICVLTVLAIWPAGWSTGALAVLLLLVSAGAGTSFPITMVTSQNAVPQSQIGTVTGLSNLFRSLGGALLVAILGAVIIGGLASQSGTGTVQAMIEAGRAAGADFAGVFRWMFAGTAFSLSCALVCLILLKELPLRGARPR